MKQIFLLTIFYSSLCIAQNPKEVELWADNYNNKVKFLNNDKHETIIGSPFDNENFVEVEVESIGKVADKLRYNALTDQLEFMKGKEIYNLNPIPDKKIMLNTSPTTNFKFIEFDFADGASKGYTYVLVDGSQFKLLKRSVKYLKNNSQNSQIRQRDTSFEIDQKPVEYILEVDQKYYSMPKNKKEFLKKIKLSNPEFLEALEMYNPKSEKDLISLVNKINH